MSHNALMKTLAHSAEQGKLWQVILFSFLHAGLLISVTLSFFPDDVSQWLSPLTQNLFVSDIAKASWIMIPIAAMAVLGGGGRRSRDDR